ncbi:hypothetical protein [Paenibacillus sp. IHBB 3054]|uniref:hypothetical protein n=1 Tax=Paenibacillus sp. IHBB 3054 TaxID=3425689 RepID=UPI003F677A26
MNDTSGEEIKPTIDEGEKLAAEALSSDLEIYIKGINESLNLISFAIDLAPEKKLLDVRSSLKVTISLLMKMINDLRTMIILAPRGYSVQTATIASSLYETAYTLTYIGGNDSLADEWISHTDERHTPFASIKKITEEVISQLFPEDYDSLFKGEYHKYTQLCMAKHSNPLNQMLHVYKYESNVVIAEPGPETSEHSIRLTCFSLVNGISFASLALGSYINHHHQDINSEFIKQFNELRSYYEELQNTSFLRWGNTE